MAKQDPVGVFCLAVWMRKAGTCSRCGVEVVSGLLLRWRHCDRTNYTSKCNHAMPMRTVRTHHAHANSDMEAGHDRPSFDSRYTSTVDRKVVAEVVHAGTASSFELYTSPLKSWERVCAR